MNKRIKAAVTAAVIAVSAVFVPVAASPAVYAAGQSQANENNTEFARAIINSSDRAPDRFLDKKYPDIAEKLIKYTSSITAGAADKYEAALKLYDWMVYNVEYKWGTFGPDSIGYILEKHQGTCTDFSFTFMAWLRYNGVKAWCATDERRLASEAFRGQYCVKMETTAST